MSEYFVPYFWHWNSTPPLEAAFGRLLNDLRATRNRESEDGECAAGGATS